MAKPQSDSRSGSPANINNLYLMTAGLALGRWPLFITYAAVKLWPTGNLGLLGAALVAGHIVASFLWRDPGRLVLVVIRLGAAVTVICTVALVSIDSPISDATGAGLVFALAAISSASRSVTGTAHMELMHRRVDTTTSVRVMTMLDVIGSTTAQLNMFIAGFLIAASTSGPIVMGMDVYQLWLLVTVLVPLAAAARLRLLSSDVASEAVSADY